MIEIVSQYKNIIIAAVILLLLFNNREKLSFLWRWIPNVFSIFSFSKKTDTATPDDRKNLYDCLIQLQDYLAVCGVDRDKMDSLTLSEVGEITVSAVTATKPSRDSSLDIELDDSPLNTKIPV